MSTTTAKKPQAAKTTHQARTREEDDKEHREAEGSPHSGPLSRAEGEGSEA